MNFMLKFPQITVEKAFKMVLEEEKNFYLEHGVAPPQVSLKLPSSRLIWDPKFRTRFLSNFVAYCAYNHRRYQIAYKVEYKEEKPIYIEIILIKTQEIGDAEKFNIYIPRR